MVSVLFAVSSLAPMTVLRWWQILDVYLWNKWIDGLINAIFSAILAPNTLVILTCPSSSAESNHSFPRLWLLPCPPHPLYISALSPPRQTTLSSLKAEVRPHHFPLGLSTGPWQWQFPLVLSLQFSHDPDIPRSGSGLKPQSSTLNNTLIPILFWFTHNLWWMNKWTSEWMLEVLKRDCRRRNWKWEDLLGKMLVHIDTKREKKNRRLKEWGWGMWG